MPCAGPPFLPNVMNAPFVVFDGATLFCLEVASDLIAEVPFDANIMNVLFVCLKECSVLRPGKVS